MEKNRILRNQDNTKIIRVLEVKESLFLVIDCIKRTMPQWKDKEQFKDWKYVTEQELWEITNIYPSKTDTALSATSKYIQEHYSLIAGILPFIGDEKERSRMIRTIAELKNYSKQTVRNTLCLYLVYQDISVFAPKEKKEKELSGDEKIMRWSLNKFFYTKNQNTLTTAYTMMLKEKYTDAEGTLLPHPSIHQFRYFYKKTRNQQNFYISREGMKKYQRNRRPLLGEGVQEFASSIGMAMLDSTICDIFITAEEVIPEHQEIISCNNRLELKLTQYITSVFQSDINMENQVSVGEFLHMQMQGTEYLSLRGEQRNIRKLHQDFVEYYRDLQDKDFTELWQIQKVFTNDRYRLQDVCMLAMFLRVEPEKMVNRELPEVSQIEQFEKSIYQLHEQGMKYPEIAKTLGGSYDTVKCIGEGRYKKYKKGDTGKSNIQRKKKRNNWKKIDKETLPLVQTAISDIWEDKLQNGKPGRVTAYAVTRALGLPSKRLNQLPLCYLEIQKYKEEYPRYWARKVVWAVQEVLKNGDELTWRKIRELTNLEKTNFQKCFPYLSDETEKEVVEKIKSTIAI